jgi:hypothetical protein
MGWPLGARHCAEKIATAFSGVIERRLKITAMGRIKVRSSFNEAGQRLG